jgi:hypothetical protein
MSNHRVGVFELQLKEIEGLPDHRPDLVGHLSPDLLTAAIQFRLKQRVGAAPFSNRFGMKLQCLRDDDVLQSQRKQRHGQALLMRQLRRRFAFASRGMPWNPRGLRRACTC